MMKGLRKNAAPLPLLQTLLVSLDHLLDHLATDGASLTGGQVAVIAIGQVNANFLCSLHLEAVHSLTGLGNIDLIVVIVAHGHYLLCRFPGKEVTFRWKTTFLSVTIV